MFERGTYKIFFYQRKHDGGRRITDLRHGLALLADEQPESVQKTLRKHRHAVRFQVGGLFSVQPRERLSDHKSRQVHQQARSGANSGHGKGVYH